MVSLTPIYWHRNQRALSVVSSSRFLRVADPPIPLRFNESLRAV